MANLLTLSNYLSFLYVISSLESRYTERQWLEVSYSAESKSKLRIIVKL